MLDEMGLRVWEPHLKAASASRATDGGALASSLPEARASRPEPTSTPPIRTAPRPELGLSSMAAEPLRVAGLQQMDWVGLQTTVAHCSACKLCSGRSQGVFGVGSLQAHWLVVGDAPAAQDGGQGEPFVGKSGQLLDNMLRAIQCTQHETFSDGRRADAAHQVFLTTAVKCRPPGQRNPEATELVQCEPYLARQVGLLRPRIILAMGRFAIQSLLGSTEPMGRLRGRVHRYQGVPLVVTYPPAYLLRSPQDKAKAWDDLCLALRVVCDPLAF